MKIIHLSTSQSGGAGIAATRLNAKLLEKNIDSTIIYLSSKSKYSIPNQIFYHRSKFQKLTSYVLTKINQFFSDKSFFSLISINSLNIERFILSISPSKTVIHVHNFYNFISLKEIFKLSSLGYSVVLTMHDQRLMTGGCHSTYSCSNFETGCKNCPQLPLIVNKFPGLNFKNQTKLLSKNAKINVIAPSLWMLKQAKSSPVISGLDMIHIPNAIYSRLKSDPRIFGNELKIGIASVDPNSKLKGSLILKSLMDYQQTIKYNFFTFIYLQKFGDNSHDEFWESIDILFVPSLHDNSPNVIHEAKSYGIPVVASNIGGILEMLHENFDSGFNPKLTPTKDIIAIFAKYRNRTISSYNVLQMQISFESYLDDPITRHLELYRGLALDIK